MKLDIEILKKRRLPIGMGLGIVLLFLLHVADVLPLGFVHRMENLAYDLRLNMSLPGGVDPRVVIVDIDDESLAAEGHWPWPRNKLSQMVNRLFDDYGVRVLGFDSVFAETDASETLASLNRLAKSKGDQGMINRLKTYAPELDRDDQFADSIKGRPVILGYYFRHDADKEISTGVLPEPLFRQSDYPRRKVRAPEASGFGANLEILQKNALGGGHFNNPLVDDDGIFRRVPLLQEYDGAFYPSLALMMAKVYLGAEIKPVFVENLSAGSRYPPLEGLKLGHVHIPLDQQTAVLVPYRGPHRSFPYVSATDVIKDKVEDPGLFKGKIVLLGTTAPGLQDLRSTPVQSVYPGVEVHANIIAGILDESFRQKPAYLLGVDFVLLVLIGFAMAVFLPIAKPKWSIIVSGAVLVLVISLNLHAWFNEKTVLPLASSVLLIMALFVVNTSYGFLVESRARWHLGKLFGQYIPPELVEEMSEHPEDYSLEAEKKVLTVLFSDIRGFTQMSENLDPSELAELLNHHFLTPMTRVIHKHRGTIDKYMGDAIMAFWGAPISNENHINDSLGAALDMAAEVKTLNSEFAKHGWPELRIGIGLNTGDVNVGNMGSEFRMAYTVLGDEVNLASRLEGLTKQYGVTILVGPSTRRESSGFVFRELDRVKVKGKNKAVTVHELLGREGRVDAELLAEISLWEETLKLYRQKQWDQCEMQLINLQNRAPDNKIYKVYVDRIQHFRSNQPDNDWDGVFVAQSK